MLESILCLVVCRSMGDGVDVLMNPSVLQYCLKLRQAELSDLGLMLLFWKMEYFDLLNWSQTLPFHSDQQTGFTKYIAKCPAFSSTPTQLWEHGEGRRVAVFWVSHYSLWSAYVYVRCLYNVEKRTKCCLHL